LSDSKLPALYYSEAQLCAVYLHNRSVHGKDSITPFEHIFKRKPSVQHLIPFGCHGYLYIKKERRNQQLNMGEIEPVAVKCRMIGYADDDELEEISVCIRGSSWKNS
jgi:hypothetical protein